MRRRLPLFTMLTALAACGGGETPPADAPAAATPPEYTIVANDFTYDAPDTISGGLVSLKLVNQGKEYHHVQLVRLLEGKTYADLTAGLQQMQPGAPPPPWIEEVVGPNTPESGGESSIMVDLTPGDYAIICFVDTPDHVPHVAKGMIRPLTVTPPTGPAPEPPVTDVTVQMTDYDWSIAPALTAGRHTIRLENLAEQPHEMFLFKLDPGKTQEDFMQWGMTFDGRPPGQAMGGTSAQRKGDVAYVPVNLTPGEYLLVCFIPDIKDGKPHLVHGMIKSITIS